MFLWSGYFHLSLGSKLKLPHYNFRALMAFIGGVDNEDGEDDPDDDVDSREVGFCFFLLGFWFFYLSNLFSWVLVG